MKRNSKFAALMVLMLAFVVAAGCSKKPAPAGAPTTGSAAPGQTEAAKPAGGGSQFTFADLCTKMVAEMKTASAGKMPEMALNQAKEGCMKSVEAHQKSPEGAAMMDKFATELLNACSSKTGKDWMTCYDEEGKTAAQNMMKK